MIRCGCGICRPSNPGEPGLWTAEYTRHYVNEAGLKCERTYRDEVEPGADGIARCPKCRDILNDDWTVTHVGEQQQSLIDDGG